MHETNFFWQDFAIDNILNVKRDTLLFNEETTRVRNTQQVGTLLSYFIHSRFCSIHLPHTKWRSLLVFPWEGWNHYHHIPYQSQMHPSFISFLSLYKLVLKWPCLYYTYACMRMFLTQTYFSWIWARKKLFSRFFVCFLLSVFVQEHVGHYIHEG